MLSKQLLLGRLGPLCSGVLLGSSGGRQEVGGAYFFGLDKEQKGLEGRSESQS